MIVCVCNAITEHDIDEAVDNGATSMDALRNTLRISTQCGSCSGCAEACLERALVERPRAGCKGLPALLDTRPEPLTV